LASASVGIIVSVPDNESREYWKNVTDIGKLKYFERNMPQPFFVHHKSYMNFPEI
jgi:hypothetical protein